ncbi:hypothetical protein WCN79_13205 [Xanthomonas axonopodis pv. vasculorum]|uniref:hypothetical protein n=1 Tax=Xanthomonas axonopodis TaxID=53413 RepID=UPI0005B38EC2|nr:hypothetical protein [Xanthomonas axonopodis]
MDTNTLALLSASVLTAIIGLARVVAWILDRRAEAALRAHRQQVVVIESYAELVVNSQPVASPVVLYATNPDGVIDVLIAAPADGWRDASADSDCEAAAVEFYAHG